MAKTNIGIISKEHPELLREGPLTVREQQVLRLIANTRKVHKRAPTLRELDTALHATTSMRWLRLLWLQGYVDTSLPRAHDARLTSRMAASARLSRKGYATLAAYDRKAQEAAKPVDSVLIALRIDGRQYKEFLDKQHDNLVPYVVGATRYLKKELPRCAVAIPLFTEEPHLYDLVGGTGDLGEDDAPELTEEFFDSAVLTKPGEDLVEAMPCSKEDLAKAG